MSVPVVLMGLGEIGRAIGRAVVATPELEIRGAVDLSPELEGRLLPDLLEAPAPELKVERDPARAFKASRGGVVIMATGSRLDRIVKDIETAVRAGLSVVSTCEELACPWVRHPELADRLERLAEERNVTILGTGVNPGFVLDRLVGSLAQVVGRVEAVRARRVVEADSRRPALQKKIGLGLSEAEFRQGTQAGELGHVGLMESAALVTMALGVDAEELEEEVEPILAGQPVRYEGGEIAAGAVRGVHQIARAFVEERELVRLELEISVGAQEPGDSIHLDGEPPVELRIPGGLPGDAATAWAVVHAARLVGEGVEPGLLTVLDLPSAR